ncbi:MAG: histidine--tRNA ligase [Rhodocyclaceae bacterium]
MTQPLQAVRGMNDVLPEEAERWEAFEAIVRDWLAAYGYRPIRLPVVEATPLFARAIGEATDIVEKEMYSFVDSLNGESLTLRPEGTASCVRAVLEHNLLYGGPQRLWYSGPMFRHERPQKGRYRQFHQFGVEALGLAGPDVDAEHIVMCARLWKDLGIEGIRLEINSLGAVEERRRHREELISYFEGQLERLDADAKRRLYSNPLRILDSKNPHMRPIVDAAPKLVDHLGEASRAHFEGVKRILDELGIGYTVNPCLVRGLDYYNLTVFEWVSGELGAQGTVCAGGRYDGLVEQLGGRPAPACGFALGVERLLALWSAAQRGKVGPDVFLVHQGRRADLRAFSIAEQLREDGYSVILHCGEASFKSQMKRADASGALIAVIVGEDEVEAGEATVKPLREAQGQRRVAFDALSDHLADFLFSGDERDGGL